MSCIYYLKKVQTEVNIGGYSQRLMLVSGKLLTMKALLNIIKLAWCPVKDPIKTDTETYIVHFTQPIELAVVMRWSST